MKDIQVCGQPVAVAVHGEPDSPPLLLIHGAGHDHGVWDAVVPGLAAAGHRVIAPDLPAHGASGGEALTSIDAMADWVLALADALGLGSFRIAGHSMGSLVALAVAARTPDRVRTLYLLGSLAPMPVAPFVLDAVRNDPPKAWALINKFSFAPAAVLGEARRREVGQPDRAEAQRGRGDEGQAEPRVVRRQVAAQRAADQAHGERRQAEPHLLHRVRIDPFAFHQPPEPVDHGVGEPPRRERLVRKRLPLPVPAECGEPRCEIVLGLGHGKEARPAGEPCGGAGRAGPPAAAAGGGAGWWCKPRRARRGRHSPPRPTCPARRPRSASHCRCCSP